MATVVLDYSNTYEQLVLEVLATSELSRGTITFHIADYIHF